jgi:exodeoxyribonuclease-5
VPSLGCDYLFVDEGSMVPIGLWDDLCSFNKPIIVTGDPGQLEPIGSDARLMHEPDIVLDTIHRYDGSIAWFANRVREDGHYPMSTGHDGEVSIFTKDRFQNVYSMVKFDVILCGLNKTRVALNKWIRSLRFMATQPPIVPGEKLICLHNDRELGVFNGLTMIVDKIHAWSSDYSKVDVTFDDGRVKHELPLWHGHVASERQLDWRRFPKGKCIVDYAYALTVHKFQGSEDEHVAVLDEVPDGGGWDMARWRYTAVTRASSRLTVFI